MSRPHNPGGRVYNDRPPERRGNKKNGGGGPNRKSPGLTKYARAAEAAARQRQREEDGRGRRRSMAAMTLKKGAMAAVSGAKAAGGALSRWFGVVDEVQMRDLKQDYNRRKMTMVDTPRGLPAIGHHRTQKRAPIFSDMSSPEAIRAALKQAAADSSSDDGDDHQIVVNPKNFTRDIHAGLNHYRKIRRMERARDVKPGWFGGEKNQNRRSLRGYRTVRGKAPAHKHSQVRNQTLVQLQLHSMSTFYPYFIYTITAAQVLITLAMCVHAYTTESFANMGIASVVTKCDRFAASNDPLECPFDFTETRDTVVNRTDEFNWSIGPSYKYLMNYGAKFTPCMRADTGIETAAAKQRSEECVWQVPVSSPVGYQCDESLFTAATDGTNGYACCRLPLDAGSVRCGMTSHAQCTAYHETARIDMDVTSWVQGQLCDDREDFITLRPCCGGIDETCEVTTEEQCAFKVGFWHADKMLCSDTMCLDTGCKFWDSEEDNNPVDTVTADPKLRNIPDNPNQWYRFVLPLFIHGGLIHVLVISIVQYYAGKSVESQAGFLRTFLIYFISGIGGNMISAIFSPKTISMGADPAVYGLLGVMLVELFQAWQIIPSPLKQLSPTPTRA